MTRYQSQPSVELWILKIGPDTGPIFKYNSFEMTGDSCRSNSFVNIASGARSAPIHFLNQCWFWIEYYLRNTLQPNIFEHSFIFVEMISLENVHLLFFPEEHGHLRVKQLWRTNTTSKVPSRQHHSLSALLQEMAWHHFRGWSTYWIPRWSAVTIEKMVNFEEV